MKAPMIHTQEPAFLELNKSKTYSFLSVILLYSLLLFFTYCSSGNVRQEESDSVATAKILMKSLSESDTSKDEINSRKLENLLSKDPSLYNRAELQSLASDLFSNKETELKTCAVSIEEPEGKTYVMNGFTEPLRIIPGCGELGNLPIQLRSEGAVRFRSPKSHLDTSVRVDTLVNRKAEFEINALSMKAEENTFTIQSASRYNLSILEIFKKLGVNRLKGEVQFNPSRYTIKNLPTAYSRDYEQHGDKLFSPNQIYS